MHQPAHDGVDHHQPDDAVGDGDGDVAWRAVAGGREQSRNRRRALDQIIIGGFGGIGAGLAVAERADIDDGGIDRGQRLVVEAEPRHRLRAHIVDQRVGALGQSQQRVAPLRLFEIEHDAALAAIGIEKHSAHAGRAAGTDLPNDVALGAFDLDDIGAHVRQHLGAVGAHQHRGQVENGEAGKRSHGASLDKFIYVELEFRKCRCQFGHATLRRMASYTIHIIDR